MSLNFPELGGPSVEEQILNCQANLKKPNVRYPNGRMSHEVETEYMNMLIEDLDEHRLNGRYYADGRFAGY